MVGILVPVIILVGSVALMASAIIQNQLDPTYSNALGIPYANIVSLAGTLLGTGVAAAVYLRRKHSRVLKRVVVIGAVLSIALIALFPLAEMGYLSRVR
ncbi:MAG: hypothetical protein MI806_09940 [Minwuiales bacterium]|nr:hypothetical protein [Minwuiales bacterium]